MMYHYNFYTKSMKVSPMAQSQTSLYPGALTDLYSWTVDTLKLDLLNMAAVKCCYT